MAVFQFAKFQFMKSIWLGGIVQVEHSYYTFSSDLRTNVGIFVGPSCIEEVGHSLLKFLDHFRFWGQNGERYEGVTLPPSPKLTVEQNAIHARAFGFLKQFKISFNCPDFHSSAMKYSQTKAISVAHDFGALFKRRVNSVPASTDVYASTLMVVVLSGPILGSLFGEGLISSFCHPSTVPPLVCA